MASSPQFANIPVISSGQIGTANSSRDGSGTTAVVVTGAGAGTRIDVLDVKATAATTAGMIRVYLYNGSTHYLLTEIPVTAVTPSATVATFETAVTWPEGLVIPSGWSLKVSTEKAEQFNLIARGGNL